MSLGDTVYFIENKTIKEATLTGLSGGFATVRYKKPYHELVCNKTFNQNCGIKIRVTKIYDSRLNAECALTFYNSR